MTCIYREHVILTEDCTLILLKRIESININKDSSGEGTVMDVLKDDIKFNITTMTGKDYTISLNYLRQGLVTKYECNNKELLNAILDAWVNINA